MNCCSDAGSAIWRAILNYLCELSVGAFIIYAGTLPQPALAEAYPSHTITVVVPFPPGGIADSVARILAPALSAALAQNIIIENRGGSGGNFGVATVSRAAPDGYTVLMTPNSPVVMNPFMYKSYPIEPEAGLTPIAAIGQGYMALAVQVASPINSVSELIAVAKQRPDELTFGHLGVGSSHYVVGALLNSKANIGIVPIPFQGAGPAIQALLGGHIAMTYGTLSALMPYVQSGQLKLLAVAEARRVSQLPQVPTIAETVPGVMTFTWEGVFGPPKLPEAIVDRLYKSIKIALESEEVQQKLIQIGIVPNVGTPDELKSTVRQDLVFWRDAIASAGFKPQ